MKLKLALIFLALSGTCTSTALFAQYANVATPSAGSMGLVNSIQSSVNYPTGKVNIEIPLLSSRYSGMQVPVSIAYNASGIRIEYQAGEVGLGWRLVAGGKITRIVKQRPDENGSSLLWGLIPQDVSSMPWGWDSVTLAQKFFDKINGKYNYYLSLKFLILSLEVGHGLRIVI